MPAVESRVAALDVLRGVAILGTFASNAWLFAHPAGPAALLLGTVPEPGPVEAGLRLLSNGKFLALLTLLFGVGIELQYRAAVRRGRPWPGRYPVRAAILLVEGLLHFVLIFEFDVLMGYAIASVVVAHLVGRSDRVVRRWIGITGGVYVALMLAVTALAVVAPDGEADAAPGAAAAAPSAAAADPTASWLDQVGTRLDHAALFRVELLLIVPSATVLFLVGSRLVRAGAFADDARGARLRRRLAGWGLGIGLPLNAATTFAGGEWFLVDRYLVPPLVALGLLSIVTTAVLRGWGRGWGAPVRRGLAAVGRTALTCYVGQNLVASLLCYGWGLGLAARFADLRPWWVLGLWATVSLLMVAAATAWLRRADRGPIELLAHRLYDRPVRPHASAVDEPGPAVEPGRTP